MKGKKPMMDPKKMMDQMGLGMPKNMPPKDMPKKDMPMRGKKGK